MGSGEQAGGATRQAAHAMHAIRSALVEGTVTNAMVYPCPLVCVSVYAHAVVHSCGMIWHHLRHLFALRKAVSCRFLKGVPYSIPLSDGHGPAMRQQCHQPGQQQKKSRIRHAERYVKSLLATTYCSATQPAPH